MEISEYFATTQGHGVLATANDKGKVNAAVYSKPYFTDEHTAVFIMAERLSYENLKTNPKAVYLFIESTEEWTGKRLYLKKTKEENNEQLVARICEACDYSHYDVGGRHVTYFEVEEVIPLLGGNYESLA
jgi:putative heme iron utilization protein